MNEKLFFWTAPMNKKIATGLWNLTREFYVVAGEFSDPRCLHCNEHPDICYVPSLLDAKSSPSSVSPASVGKKRLKF